MKRLFGVVLCVLFFAAPVRAKELSVAGVLSDGETYAGKSVTVRGDFLYSEPVRESFTIGEGSSTIEVFFRDLPGNDKLYLLSLPKDAKRSLLVSGTLRQYANKERSFFIEAVSLGSAGAAPASVRAAEVSIFDIQSNPADYLNRPVTMKGEFLYSEPLRQSFTFQQNGRAIEVILSDLSKADRDRVLRQKENSGVRVTVTGLLQHYANDDNRFFITAYTVTLWI